MSVVSGPRRAAARRSSRGTVRRPGAGAVVAVATVVAAVLLAVLATVLPPVPGDAGGDLVGRVSTVVFAAAMTGLAWVGAVVIRRRPGDPMGRVLLATALAGVLGRLAVGLALAAAAWWPAAVPVLGWISNWAWVPAQALALVLLVRFPTGRPASRPWEYVERLLLGWAVATVVVTAVVPGPFGVDTLAGRNPLGADSLAGPLDAALDALFVLMPLLVLLAVAAPVVRWRSADPVQRQQLRWVAAAGTVIAVAAPLAYLTQTGALLEAAGYLAVPAGIAVAVLRYRLWDLGLVVRRSVASLVAGAVLAGGYLGVVLLLDVTLEGHGWLGAVVGAVTVAAVAAPVHQAARRALDRLLFGDRRDPYAVVRALGERLEDSSSDALGAMVAQLARSLRLPAVAVRTVDGAVLARSGEPGPGAARVPLVRGEVCLGHLLAGPRAGGERLTALDLRLLEELAPHAAVAVQAALLDGELERSYQRLRTVRERERARLRRELHDGLGPVLGAVTMRAEAARNLVASGAGAGTVDDVLRDIGRETEGAVREVRRLIDELAPSLLVEHGLVAALEDFRARYLPGLAVRLDTGAAPLRCSAAAEAAAYRVATEALRNVQRHAGTDRCSLRLDVVGEDLVVEVRDEGHGMGDAPEGVGLGAMRARVAETGGRLEVASSDRGTTVLARLPRDAS